MFLTFKQKLNLTSEQKDILEKTSEEARILYNHLLEQKNNYYNQTKEHLSYFKQQATLKEYKTEYLTFDMKKEVCRLLDNNFKSYYTLLKYGKVPHVQAPKFRGNHYFFTLSFAQDFSIKNNLLQISNKKCKFIKIPIKHFFDEEKTKFYNKTKSILGDCKIFKKGQEYFACISYDYKEKDIQETKKLLSIDLGKKNIITYYDEETKTSCNLNADLYYKNLTYFDKRIDNLTSKIFKKQKDSRKANKLKATRTRLQLKRKQQSRLALHKLSKELSKLKRDIIIGELTNLKRNTLTEYKRLNRQMQNNWQLMTFIDLLEYKCRKEGRKLVKVNEAWTSKTCCKCGSINEGLTPSIRTYKCECCGNVIDRDVNGAINILKRYKQTTKGDYSTPELEKSNKMFFGNSRKTNDLKIIL